MPFDKLTPQDLANIASRDFILGNTTVEEYVEFIEDQIKSPFDSGDSNFFKRLKSMVNGDRLDEICVSLFGEITDVYPGVEFDISETDQHLATIFNDVYRFFIRNIHKHMYVFLREYIYSSKNRKSLIAEHISAKLPNYPKEQYGTKEFYILISKLPSIIRDIADNNLTLKKFIDYIERSGSMPMYVDRVRDYISDGIINDSGSVADIFSIFFKSSHYSTTINKLQMAITKDIINPYLKKNHLTELKMPTVEPIEDEGEDDDDEDGADEACG